MEKKRIQCKHCDHIQVTHSVLGQVTCSSCGKKTPTSNEVKKE